VGFVPAASPKLVILVMVDTPEGDIYGGTVAAPVFRAVAEQSLAYLQVAPDDAGGGMLLVNR
jgi:cell division protein FtsI (penicillin-binding protein 3)